MLPTQTHILILSHYYVLSGEATNTNLTFFGLTWQGLKLTIYHTLGEHANHYTTDAVVYVYIYKPME